MAKGNQHKERVYKGEMIPSRELNENMSVEGTFQGVTTITLTDQNTKEEKDVQRYLFRDGNGGKFVILGRTMLNAAFEEVFEQEGGMEKCIGLEMRIERGADSKLSGKRTMGSYTVAVWEN